MAGLDYHRGFADALAAQSPADLRRFVKHYGTRRPVVVGALVPQGKEGETESVLRQFVPLTTEGEP